MRCLVRDICSCIGNAIDVGQQAKGNDGATGGVLNDGMGILSDESFLLATEKHIQCYGIAHIRQQAARASDTAYLE
jgi:hypothetical protein